MESTDAVGAGLSRFLRSNLGAGATVTFMSALGGHSGFNFGFSLQCGSDSERLVLRLSPPGARTGSTADPVRMVPILQAAAAAGVPVPRVWWASSDPEWLGGSFTIVDHMAGHVLPDIFDPRACSVAAPEIDVAAVFRSALEVLALVHRVPLSPELAARARIRSLPEVVAQSLRPLRAAHDPEWIRLGHEVHDLLLRSVPLETQPALVHHDYYSNNWIVSEDSVTAVLDWESTIIADPAVDLGWFLMMYDATFWGPTRRKNMGWAPDAAQLLAWQEDLTGPLRDDLNWFRALAAYRLACGSCHYIALHRSGKRPDQGWVDFEDTVEVMFERAAALLRAPALF